MYILLLVIIAVLLLIVKAREGFLGFLPDAMHVGGNDWFNFDPHGEGQEVYSATPNTCIPPNSDLNGVICYPPCRPGYHGVGPVCWADSVNVGIGTPVGLEPCPDGWDNDGLTCRNPIRCDPIQCHSAGDCFMHGKCGCSGGGCHGGEIKGRLDHGGVCPGPGGGDDHKDKVDGLCYKQCPKELPNHMPGMPYLCYKGGELSYGRGVGVAAKLLRLGGTISPF